MKKKLLSILLVLSLMLALVPAAFAADTGTLEGGLTWELDSTGLLTISGEGAIPDNNAGLCRCGCCRLPCGCVQGYGRLGEGERCCQRACRCSYPLAGGRLHEVRRA